MRKKNFCHFCGARLTEKFVEGMLRLFCRRCDEPIYENPVPATCLVVVDDGDGVLLVKRSVEPKKGDWCLPGGYVELGETPEASALRELEEETGLTGEIERLLAVASSPSTEYDTVLLVCYVGKKSSGHLKAGGDASDAAYFRYGELPEIAFSSHRKFIDLYFAGNAF